MATKCEIITVYVYIKPCIAKEMTIYFEKFGMKCFYK